MSLSVPESPCSTVLAMVLGGLSRLVLRRRGDFWRIAGHRVSEIDGFNPATVKPFDEFAMLGPADPAAAATELSTHVGAPVTIVDANNINVEVLGSSVGFPVDASAVRATLRDNPMGQGDERTPIILVRRVAS